ncbi:MAG: hypothetical protein RL088_3292 [Verrucomicrobiota bacterium]|jgi:WD40 repeat protein/predicted Ser/Thr protein kinase
MAEPTAKQSSCPDCGREYAGSSGLCPACLWAGLDSVEGTLLLQGLEVVCELARGGMGVVYRAKERGAGREVAVKMMLTSLAETPGARERFAQEARAVGAMDHPGILPVYHVGEQNGLPYFTMKLAGGGTLAARRARLGGRWRESAALIAEIADAVDHAHRHGLLHRDLKPANILFDDEGRSYVSDFGLVKIAGDNADLTRTVAMLGTPHYLSPEVASRDARAASVASDIWSLGAMLYELLAGRLPFEADGIPLLMRKIVESEPDALPAVPRDLATIARKCLRKNPQERYGTAAELARDLRAWLDGRTISARRATIPERFRSWARRNPALAASMLIVTVATVGVILLQARMGRELRSEKQAAVSAQADALAAQIAAARIGGRIDQRDAALEATRALASLRVTDDIRDDAITLLATPGWSEAGSANIPGGDALFFARSLHWIASVQNGAVVFASTNGQPEHRPANPEGVEFRAVVKLDNDGKKATAWDSTATFWEYDRSAEKWTRLFKHDNPGTTLVWRDVSCYAAFDTVAKRTTVYANGQQIPFGTDTGRPKAFSPDGALLAVEDMQSIELYDLESRKLLRRIPLPPPGSNGTVIKWRSDSKAFAVVSGWMEVFVVYIDGDGPLIETLSGYGALDVAWHPSSEWIGAVNGDGTLRIWETTGRREILRVPILATQLEFSDDGSLLAVRERFSPRLALYNFSAPTCVRQALLPRKSTSADGRETPSPPWGCAILEGAAVGIVTGQLGLEWIDTATAKSIQRGPDGAFWKVATPGRYILALGSVGGETATLTKYHLTKDADEIFVKKDQSGSRSAVGFSSTQSGRALALEAGQGLIFFNADSEKKNLVSLKALPPLTGTFFPGTSALSPDGRWLAVSSGTASPTEWIAVWDTTAPEAPPAKLSGFSMTCGFAFSPDSTVLYVHSQQRLCALNTGSWGTRWSVPRGGNSFSLSLLAISGDGQLLAAAAAPNGIALVDAASGKKLALPRHPDLRPFGALALSNDGGLLLATGIPSSAQIWDINDLRQSLSEKALDWNAPKPPFNPRHLPAKVTFSP